MDPALQRIFDAMDRAAAVISVWGANYYAHAAGVTFTTRERDLFLPPDPDNLVRAWKACDAISFSLWAGDDVTSPSPAFNTSSNRRPRPAGTRIVCFSRLTSTT
jgi:hypothetical protein